ncbi:protein of unknown function DUF214 [Xylanimonas cellulosilytica DSM 15894]|uniref:ABC3 transporter permease C-terminal domain-containing protein n=1 Tax=Xylanimonas cellulosilytica (strain DSM 15894 / JCM 12276 / CECT 5975 / KCTC 9989 / LMG 20990 / NBRC 107835 / XIL07) TaxID=446471 RepID=D1BX50_XYLCX|nr:FtsX-like permease family protein [Xylanimonas cellulosilytica]ACZ31618.1 protein of unknown function DUF214 [Xylanimonas cellulosilytica DSM 15894]
MLRLTLAQMRRSLGRLAAAGIAVVIGTAFVAATLLAGDLITRSVHDSIASQFAQSDLVVEGTLTADDVEGIAAAPGVAAAQGVLVSHQGISAGNRTIWQATVPLPDDARLNPLVLAEGEWPAGDTQIALPPDVAERLQVDVGDTVGVERWVVAQTTTADDGSTIQESELVTDELTVSGLVDDPRNAYSRYGGAAVMTGDALTDRIASDGTDVTFEAALVVLTGDATLDDARAALLDAAPGGASVVTPDEHAAAVAESFTGGQDVVFLVFVLTFAAIALLVAGLVITNTFQVLVAQRTRTLALLRAVGANKRQVGSGVLLEATLLGVAASLTGVLVGCGLGQLALVVAARSEAAAFLPATIALTWQVVLVPVLVGTAVTVLAALVPARSATRVAPLAALRPDDAPSVEKGSSGRVRLVLSSLAVVGGLALLAGGAGFGANGDAELGLLAGVAGGAVSFVGIAVGAVFWLPRVASWAGRLAGLTGPTARLAAANTLRNPRRTAATSTALLIGVTLVAMMSTAATSARTSLTASLDETFPIDVAITAMDDGDGPVALPADLVSEVTHTDGVTAVATPTTTTVTVTDRFRDDDGTVVVGQAPPSDSTDWLTVHGIDGDVARATLNDATLAAGLEPGVVSISQWMADNWLVADGETITLAGPSGEVTLTADVVAGQGLGALLVTPEDLAGLDADAVSSQLWVSLPAGDLTAVGTLQDLVSDAEAPAFVQGAAVTRADYESVIDTALGVVLGLLAVAVVIALIGVANTLSLSVLERRRESATLRAIGVTRGQLRRMLAIEGMLIAGVGAVLGIVLGLVYGWAGSLAALGIMGPVELAVPWRDLVLVAVIALVAGLVASVAPGRSAVRPSPVAALATE